MESKETKSNSVNPIWILSLTSITMVAFAANAILCRAALRPTTVADQVIDPASYTSIRIFAGAVVLLFIQLVRRRSIVRQPFTARKCLPPVMLVLYAIAFSFAYISLDTASGTLILFAFVQLTMISIGLLRGEFPRPIEIMGLLMASGGLVYLVSPNVQTPLLKESILMAAAGISWGIYSVLGKKSEDSISDTTFNFVLGIPAVLLISLLFWSSLNVTFSGAFLAAASGGIASGLGYVMWYTVLPVLRSTQAAAVQLSVPVIAAIGGVLFVGDPLAPRTLFSGILILIGIGLTIKWKKELS